jgi:hypothetical protein
MTQLVSLPEDTAVPLDSPELPMIEPLAFVEPLALVEPLAFAVPLVLVTSPELPPLLLPRRPPQLAARSKSPRKSRERNIVCTDVVCPRWLTEPRPGCVRATEPGPEARRRVRRA